MDTIQIEPASKALEAIFLEKVGDQPAKKSRGLIYLAWLNSGSREFLTPDLAAWRDDMDLAPSSQVNYLSTVRKAYRDLLKDARFRDLAYEHARKAGAVSPADQKALVDELTIRIQNAIDREAVKVDVVRKQDRSDKDQRRLTRAQAETLLNSPDVSTTKGLRNAAVIALFLCTGIREGELCSLEVRDLRQRIDGELALEIRSGKGNKARLIPYGELSWCLVIVDKWLEVAGIEEGPVFRGFRRDSKTVRPNAITTRSIAHILENYPISIDGEKVVVKPHDCRRTYARRLHDASLKLAAIKQNLGHVRVETTLGYIGELDAKQRRAKAIYSFDLARLEA